MKTTTKLLTTATITALLAGTSMSFASETISANNIDKTEVKAIMQKVKSGETLTDSEQEVFDSMKQGKSRGGKGNMAGNDKRGVNLTDDEKTALESMTDDEKTAFFTEKKEEMEAKRESHENVIDKLLNGETLTSDEEVIRDEIIESRAEKQAKREEMDAIKNKVEAGEDLTDEEQTLLDQKGGRGEKGVKGEGRQKGAGMGMNREVNED